MRIFFDVGANNGADGIWALSKGGYDKCYAFEIDKRLIPKIKHDTKIFGDRYILTESAVSSYNGVANYKQLSKIDVGTIIELDPEKIDTAKRSHDFRILDKYQVPVITLEQFCLDNNIQHINHLHIDTEGSDFEVIKGLGAFINNVDEGIMECIEKGQLHFYVDPTNMVKECTQYLESYNFECDFRRKSHNGNLYFKKK